MITFWIILVSLFFVAWLIHLLYYLGDERRRFRIVETKNKEFIVQKKGLFIPVWWNAIRKELTKRSRILYTDPSLDSGIYSINYTLEEAQEAVDNHFKEKEIRRKDKKIVNIWTLKE